MKTSSQINNRKKNLEINTQKESKQPTIQTNDQPIKLQKWLKAEAMYSQGKTKDMCLFSILKICIPVQLIPMKA